MNPKIMILMVTCRSKTFAKTQGKFYATVIKLQVQIESVRSLTIHHEEHILKRKLQNSNKRKLEKV